MSRFAHRHPLLLLLGVLACGAGPGAEADAPAELRALAAPEPARVTGTVTYRERIALPRDAVVYVTLVDIGRAEAPGRVLARRVIPRPGQVPVAFALEYDPDAIDPEGLYGVRATIVDGEGRVRWASREAVPVITRGHPTVVEIVVEPVGPVPLGSRR